MKADLEHARGKNLKAVAMVAIECPAIKGGVDEICHTILQKNAALLTTGKAAKKAKMCS